MTAWTMRHSRDSRARMRALAAAGAVLALVMTLITPASALAADDPEVAPSPFAPADAQNWVDQADLTWDDYTPVRPEAWNRASTSTGSQNQYRTAIILMEFTDQPLLITQEPESHPFGNPQPGWVPVPRAAANAWYEDYFAEPNEWNGGQTLHGYWMETTHGKIGVTVDVYGPYLMPGKAHEYGISSDFNGPVNQHCPQGDNCSRNIRTDGNAPFRAEVIAGGGACPGTSTSNCGYDNLFYVTAGHDESSTWQEFGEMLFELPTDVPASLGPPGATEGPVYNNAGTIMNNYAGTRYVPWTSWRSAANHWPNASGSTSTQAESSGQSVFAHEFSHLRGLPDNYNNPFADNVRNYTGYWEMMSRGTFNGPGGTHNRWQVPNAGGSGLGPHHTLHYKNQLNALTDDEQVTIARDALPTSGVAVVPLKARAHQPNGDKVGLTVNWTGTVTPTCAAQGIDPFYCVANNWTAYRIEVVDRVGNDSFVPGHGVLINQSRASGTPRVWTIDPNPQDVNMVDFYRPNGTPVMVVRGDPRQLNDATFHAGNDSGSESEFVDQYNGLHFYILDKYNNEAGELMYDIGVRRTTGAGEFVRGVSLGAATRSSVDTHNASYDIALTNTGAAGEGYFNSDIYRISSSISGEGWSTWQPHDVVAAAAGETVPVTVTATRSAEGASETATLTVTATSESDPSKSFTTTVTVKAPAATVDDLAAVVASVDPTDAQWKLRKFVDRIEREIDRENWANACVAVDVYIAEINRLAGLRPERNPLSPANAELLRAAAGDVRIALGCD